MKRRTKVIAAVSVILVVGSVAAAGVVVATNSSPNQPALTETVAEVGTVKTAVTGKGAISAASTANASFQSAGTVTSITVTVGQHVPAGHQLATIDSAAADREIEKSRNSAAAADRAVAVARGNADRARENLGSAQQALTRAQNAPPPAATPSSSTDPAAPAIPAVDDRPEKIATAKQAVRDAESAAASADAAVADAIGAQATAAGEVAASEAVKAATTLTAPIAGVVTAINGTIGSVTSGGGSTQEGSAPAASVSSGFIQISDTSSWRISVAVSESDVASVKVDQPATVTLAGSGGGTATGKVTSIAPTPTTSTEGVVSYPVIIALDQVPENTAIGRTGFVSIVVDEAKDVVVLPTEAITSTGQNEGTVRVKDEKGTLSTLVVKTGLAGNGMTQITSGVKTGDTVFVAIPTAPASGDTMFEDEGSFR